MFRATPDDGLRAYRRGGQPPLPISDYDHDVDGEAMRDLMPALAGALLKLEKDGVYSLSGPQLGSRVPAIVVKVPGDLIRIIIDPKWERVYGKWMDTGYDHIKKAREHVRVTGYGYDGREVLVDTQYLHYTNWRGLSVELQFQRRFFSHPPDPADSECSTRSTAAASSEEPPADRPPEHQPPACT